VRPTGWRSNPTSRRDLLKEAGYTHLLDWPLDDQPRPVRGAAGAVAATGACACSNAARCRRSGISRAFDSSGSPRALTAGGGQGRKRSTVGNALDTAIPNDPASFAPYLLARDPSRVVIRLASAVFGLRLATVRPIIEDDNPVSSGSHSRSWRKRVPQCHGARWRRAISRHKQCRICVSR
jgi:hypothetical protein